MMSSDYVVAFTVSLIATISTVMLHYEAFIGLTRIVSQSKISHRRRMLLLVFGLLVAHIVAIWVFGVSAWWLIQVQGIGELAGYDTLVFLDYIFMSAVTYSTLGYGDMIPLGPVRFLYGTQGLVGFVLITWSASFAFIEMQNNWPKRE